MLSRRSVQFSFLGLISLVVIILAFFIFKPYLNVLVLAAVSAVIFYPLYQKMLGKTGKYPGLAAALTVVAASVLIFTPLILAGTQIVTEANSIYAKLNDNSSQEIGPLGDIQPSDNKIIRNIQEKFEGAITNIMENFKGLFDWIISNATILFESAANLGLSIFLWFFSFYYFLRDGHKIRGLLIHFSPLSDQHDKEILGGLVRSIKSVVGGSLIVAVAQGVLGGLGMGIFGVPNPAIWGLIAIIAALIPMVGTALVMLPASAYLLLTNQTWPAVGLLIFSFLLVGGIDNILRPKLMQHSIGLHPLAILLSVLGGIAFFGPVGFLTGPIILSLLVELIQVYREMMVPAGGQASGQAGHDA